MSTPEDQTRDRSNQVTPLDRRIIEIELAEAFVSTIASRYGEEASREILSEVVQKAAYSAAEKYRRQYPEATLANLFDVWKVLGGEGRLDLVLDELTETKLRFHVKRCSYAEAYRSLGLDKLGVEFSCRRDEPFAKALIPHAQVKQSRTILEGNSQCEFEYTLEEP